MKKFILCLIAVLLSLGMAMPDVTHVAADTTLGTISGIVYDGAGNTPITSGSVNLLKYNPQTQGWLPMGTAPTSTGSNGIYSFTGLADGNYIVTAWAASHEQIFWQGGYNPNTADPIIISGGAVTSPGSTNSFDFHLGPGGSISGTVNTKGLPLSGIPVAAFNLDGPLGKKTLTGNDGSYNITNIPLGTCHVVAPIPGGNYPYATQNSADITLTANTPKTVINFNLQSCAFINVGFNSNYFALLNGDQFTDSPTNLVTPTNNVNWFSNLNYIAGINPTLDASATLSSSAPFGWVNPSPDSKASSNPTLYTWNFAGTKSVAISSGVSIQVGIPNSGSPSYEPGFDVDRSIYPTSVPTDGKETLTIHVTPRVAGSFHIVVDNWDQPFASFTVTSPANDPNSGINVYNNGQSINIAIPNPVVGTTYTETIGLLVTLKNGLSTLAYMPHVGVYRTVTVDSNTSSGNTLSYSVPELGDWKWTATTTADNYSWNWGYYITYGVDLNQRTGNQVYLNSSINYNANLDINDYNNDLEQGPKTWNVNVYNNPDSTDASVAGLQSILTSGSLNLDWANGNGPGGKVQVVNDPNKRTYTWNFGDIAPGNSAYGGAGGSGSSKFDFTPGFTIHRDITSPDQQTGQQTLTVIVTPLLPTLNTLSININTSSDSFVNPLVSSPSEPSGTYLNTAYYQSSQYNLSININNPEAGKAYTFTIPIAANFKGVMFAYMPTVNVCSQYNGAPTFASGGNASLTDPDFGEWLWTASGESYLWNLNQNVQYYINLLGSEDELNQVFIGSNISYNAIIDSDNYQNTLAAGIKNWYFNVNNSPDNSNAVITGLKSELDNTNGSIPVDYAGGSINPTHPATRVWDWNFGNVNQGDWVYNSVSFNAANFTFTPGYTIQRSITGPSGGQQQLTVTVTSQPSSQTLTNLFITINVWQDAFVNPAITLPTVAAGIGVNLSTDKQYLNINVPNPVVGTPYTFIITITDNFIGATFTYMPRVTVGGQANVSNSQTIGTGLNLNNADFGKFTWSTTSGTYLWNLGNFLQYSLTMPGSEEKANTTTLGVNKTATYSAGNQTVKLAASVTSDGGIVTQGTVTFNLKNGSTTIGSKTVNVDQGAANADFTLPGGTPAGTYTIETVYNGDAYFLNSSDINKTLIVSKAAPVITWANPADIGYGTPLGTVQLNAAASVPGKFTYKPAAGTVLPAGSNQSLHVDFVPADLTNYQTASADVKINVLAWAYMFKDSTRGTKLNINDINQTFQFVTADKDYGIKKATSMKIIDLTKISAVKYDAKTKKWSIDGSQLNLDNNLKLYIGQYQSSDKPGKLILIYHQDNDLMLTSLVVDGKQDSCIAFAKDMKTKKIYLLFDLPGLIKP